MKKETPENRGKNEVKTPSKTLTLKQEKFMLKYFECGNATESYKYAYSTKNQSEKTINENASRLANNNKVSARLNELRAKAEKESVWSVEKLIKAHTRIYEVGMGDVSSSHIVSEGAGDGVTNTLEVDLCDTNLPSAKSSLVEIGKLLGYYTAKVEVSGELNLSDFVKHLHEENKVK